MGSAAERGAELDDDRRLVRPDGLSVRRLRHARSWSPRELIDEIARANLRANGLRDSISPKELSGIEEKDAPIAYATLRLLAAGLDCDPTDILCDRNSRLARTASARQRADQKARRSS